MSNLKAVTVSLQEARTRLLFIDNIRWVVIVGVVLVHLVVTYGNIGRWYYMETRELDVLSGVFFTAFGTFFQAFSMGLLFLIAGYFVPRSYDKKGFGRFVVDRMKRLGIPTLFYMLIINPLLGFIMKAFSGDLNPELLRSYAHYVGSLHLLEGSGPLWFTLALLVFTLTYAFLRLLSVRPRPNTSQPIRISHGKIIGFILSMAVVTFAVRLVQPIGTAFYNMQLCFFPQYVILFAIGILFSRGDLLLKLSQDFGKVWFRIALFTGIPLWVLMMVFGGALQGSFEPYLGGLHWQAGLYAFWESLFCVGMCLGIIVIFRQKYNVRGKTSGFLSENAFGVFVFHALILVLIALALKVWLPHPVLKFFLVATFAVPACFLISNTIRKVQFMKKIFS